MSVPNLGVFVDGTGWDWQQDPARRLAIQRLCLRYVGPAEYRGGPGTDLRGPFLRGLEATFGTGVKHRRRELLERIQYWAPALVDLFGWSRGADEVIRLCPELELLGIPVRVLGVFDPVRAHGAGTFKRVIPLAPLARHYARPPNVQRVVQVLAGEEYRRRLRRASVELQQGELRGDVETYVRGDHRAAVGPLGEAFMVAQSSLEGVEWRDLA